MMEVAVIATGILAVLTFTAFVSDRLERRQGRKNMPVECPWCLCPTLLFDGFTLDYVCPECAARV